MTLRQRPAHLGFSPDRNEGRERTAIRSVSDILSHSVSRQHRRVPGTPKRGGGGGKNVPYIPARRFQYYLSKSQYSIETQITVPATRTAASILTHGPGRFLASTRTIPVRRSSLIPISVAGLVSAACVALAPLTVRRGNGVRIKAIDAPHRARLTAARDGVVWWRGIHARRGEGRGRRVRV